MALLEEISTLIAITDALLFSLILVLRLVNGSAFKKKEVRIKIAKHWNLMKYLSYILVVFFVACSTAIGMMLAEQFVGMVFGPVVSILNLVIVLLLFAAGVDLLLLVFSVTEADAK